jgi:SAM-dependent methyltransferase
MSKNIKIINLGLHPLADSFLKKNQIIKEVKKPLICFLNKKSGKIFLKSNFPAKYRYNFVDYSYTSSNSEASKKYWNNFYTKIKKDYKIKDKKILEIGSNDGYLLNKFEKKNFVLGVDASAQMTKLANSKYKFSTINSVFNYKKSCNIKNKYGKFDLILANNVLNHSDKEIDFLKGVLNLMSNNGIFIFEVPYWTYQIKNFYFDQIYHEHRCYFTLRYIKYLIKKLNFSLNTINVVNSHGKSLRVVLGKKKSLFSNNNDKFQKLENYENKKKIFSKKTYLNFTKKINGKKIFYNKKINNLKKLGYEIIGVGASAKGNTFLNFLQMNNKIINRVTDISKEKIGKYTPGSHIKISNDNYFVNKKKICALILSWNYSKILKEKIITKNKIVKFI